MFRIDPGTVPRQRRHPLGLPRELWSSLSASEQAVYRRAEKLLDSLSARPLLSLSRLLEDAPRKEVMWALRVLGEMELIETESTDSGTVVKLRALPEDHVSIVGPDGKQRWLFVARPLSAPVVDPLELN